jgi:hypothetical protein
VAYYGSSNLAFTLVWGRGVLLYTRSRQAICPRVDGWDECMAEAGCMEHTVQAETDSRIAVAYYGSSNLAFTLVWGRGVLLYTKVVILSTCRT